MHPDHCGGFGPARGTILRKQLPPPQLGIAVIIALCALGEATSAHLELYDA